MAIERFESHDYQVFRIREDLGLRSNISDLEEMVRESLNSGKNRIAIAFTPNSHLYSNTIAVLIRCISYAEEKNIRLVLVVPNESIMSSVTLVGLASLVDTCRGEEELAGRP